MSRERPWCLFFWGLCAVFFSGCSLFDDHTQDYLHAEALSEVVLPADVQQLTLSEQLSVPAVGVAPTENLPARFEVPRPKALDLNALETATDDEKDWRKEVNAEVVIDGNGSPVLRVNAEFPQAWVLVGASLKEDRVPIDDLDRSVGTYYVRLPSVLEGAETAQARVFEVKVNRMRQGVSIALHKNVDELADDQLAREFLQRLGRTLENSKRTSAF